jgi:hypothetical protein
MLHEKNHKTEDHFNNEEISQELKDLVIAKLDSSLNDRLVTFGDGSVTYTKAELLEHVKNEDEIGRRVIDVEVSYLDALKSGTLLDDLVSP